MKQIIKKLESDPNQTAIAGIVETLKALDKQQEEAEQAKEVLLRDADAITEEIQGLEQKRNEKMELIWKYTDKIEQTEKTAQALIEAAEDILAQKK